MTVFIFLAFCFVLIGTVFADFKRFDALENAAFDGSAKNELVKLSKESELSNRNGEDAELKQFVCDLEIVIRATLDDQGLSQRIRPSLKEEFDRKKLKLMDKPMAELLHKLQKSIRVLKNSINKGVLKMSAENLLLELAELWSKYNSQNWQNRQECAHRDKSSQAKMERQGSESRQLLNQLSHSSSKGDPSRVKSPAHPDVSNGSVHSSSGTEEITRNQLSHSSSKGDPSRGKSPAHPDVSNGSVHSSSDTEEITKTRRKTSPQTKMERQGSENQLSHSSSKGDPSRVKSPAHPDVSNGSVHSSSDTEEITKNHDYARKRGQESKKRSHLESIEKGTEKAGAQLEIQNITSDQLGKITVVSGDITKQKVSVIVTDANGQLRHGGEINDAIHRACEPEMDMLQLVLNTLIMSKRSAYPPGSVVVTDAFGNLRKNVQFIAHAVGPIVHGINPSAEDTLALKLCYTESLDVLIAKNGQTIAFPNISTETNGFPKDLAAVAALEAILNWLNTGANKQHVQQITLVCLHQSDEQLYKDLIESAKRQIVPSRPSTPRTSATSEPSTSQSPPPAPQPLAVIDVPTPIVEQTIRQTVSCVNVKGDGDCFYRAICYGLFRVDSMENSDALRKASGRILRAILENPNFFPRKRHRSHADFTHALRQLLLPSPSDIWYNKTLEAYSQFIENPARDGIGIWAQLDDAHTIAILLQRPVVILRPIAENDILQEERPNWNNISITQRIDVRFPDGEYMGMTRNIPHVQLNSFTVHERTSEDVLVERTVVNPIVIWYDGIGHYQSIIFDPMAPNASAGSEYIFAQNFDIPEDFLHGNKAPQQQHSPGQTRRNQNNGVPVALFDHLDNPDTCVHIVHPENPLFTNTSSSVVFSTSHAGFINLGNMTNSPKLKQ
ncbi:hypothetical protein GPALN_004830 [Globodera pallida]|nr:hypothetical protein GPALN_004830 [Globodera pallida]